MIITALYLYTIFHIAMHHKPHFIILVMRKDILGTFNCVPWSTKSSLNGYWSGSKFINLLLLLCIWWVSLWPESQLIFYKNFCIIPISNRFQRSFYHDPIHIINMCWYITVIYKLLLIIWIGSYTDNEYFWNTYKICMSN